VYQMVKILFVCLGNICRSPTAEGVFRHKANEAGLKDGFVGDIYIDSAGTAGFHMAAPPDKRAQLTSLKYGVDIGDLQARKVSMQDYTDFTYIIAMDNDNLAILKEQCPTEFHHKLFLFMDFAKNSPGITEIPDPYYGDIDDFERMYNIIDRAALGLLEFIKEKHHL
jgi:protein-tyrosine phosphatase